MAITPIKVNYRSIFGNGTLTAVSAGAAVWSDEERIADSFINRLATTDIAPTGLTEIEVDQGATVADYFNANRIIIPAKHNLDVALTLEYSDTGAWAGEETAVSLSADTPTPGTLFSATFTKETAHADNRYWRLSFTKTDEAIEIPEVWLTEQIELGESETTEDGNAVMPVPFDVIPNITVHRTLEGVRSAVKQGDRLRRIVIEGEALSSTAFGDWTAFLEAIDYGLNVFVIDDPVAETWFAEVLSVDGRNLLNPERWTVPLVIQEVP